MDSGEGSVGNSLGSSLPQIRESGGPAQFDSQRRNTEEVRRRKSGQTAYLQSIPPPLKMPQPKLGSEFTSAPLPQTKICESQGFSPTRRTDSDNRSFPSPSVQFTPGPASPPFRRGAPEYPSSPGLRRGSEMPGRQMRRGSEMPPRGENLRKGSVVPTGWDIHGRRDSHQSWPTNDRRLTQIMHRSGFMSQLLKARFRDDQSASYDSSDHVVRPRVPMENTYRMEPDQQFQAHIAEKIIKNVFETYLENQEYHGPLMGQKSRTLAEIIKEKVKALRYERYKIVTWVVIGQKGCNDLRIASKGLWDNENDSYAEVVYENKSLHALGVCYGIYQE